MFKSQLVPSEYKKLPQLLGFDQESATIRICIAYSSVFRLYLLLSHPFSAFLFGIEAHEQAP
jgi:hypothetical protein